MGFDLDEWEKFVNKKPRIMGIINVTPDSFSDGGAYIDTNAAIAHGLRLLEEGADILDIGGKSTRPGAQAVSVQEEMDRVLPVIEGLKNVAKYISVDTRNATTMRAALVGGANIINDISGLQHDPHSVSVVQDSDVPVIIMHMQGDPSSMQDNPFYNNILEDVFNFFLGRIDFLKANRIDIKRVVLDPGIGFGKTVEHNLVLQRYIKKILDLGFPILIGVSRKRFIGSLSGDADVYQRLPGSLAAALWGVSQGVQIFRVHDVWETRQAFNIFEAISSVEAKL